MKETTNYEVEMKTTNVITKPLWEQQETQLWRKFALNARCCMFVYIEGKIYKVEDHIINEKSATKSPLNQCCIRTTKKELVNNRYLNGVIKFYCVFLYVFGTF